MKRITQTLCLALTAMVFLGCNKNKEADSANDMHDDSVDGDHDDHNEAAEDAEESMDEAGEDIEEAADEVKDEVDGNPATE